jgi:hypothetical protein
MHVVQTLPAVHQSNVALADFVELALYMESSELLRDSPWPTGTAPERVSTDILARAANRLSEDLAEPNCFTRSEAPANPGAWIWILRDCQLGQTPVSGTLELSVRLGVDATAEELWWVDSADVVVHSDDLAWGDTKVHGGWSISSGVALEGVQWQMEPEISLRHEGYWVQRAHGSARNEGVCLVSSIVADAVGQAGVAEAHLETGILSRCSDSSGNEAAVQADVEFEVPLDGGDGQGPRLGDVNAYVYWHTSPDASAATYSYGVGHCSVEGTVSDSAGPS